MTERSGRRVAVTGIGVLATCGIGQEAFWRGLLAAPPTGERRIYDFDPEPYFENAKEMRRTDRFAQFALAGAAMALEDGGDPNVDPARRGVLIATGVGGLETLEEQIMTYHTKGPRRVSPFLVPMMMANAASAGVSMKYGWQGPCTTVVTACAASTHGIGDAANWIRYGKADAVLAGGSEAAMTTVGMQGFTNMTAMSTTNTSMPFDAKRDGFVIAEGCAVVLLEEMEAATARGAKIYGEILGSGNTADAYHITAPAPGGAGAIRCMELALEDAGVRATDIAHINAHGTSTPANDVNEAEAVNKVFGKPGPPITSTKGVTGHALGASGALELVAVLLAMQHRRLPPTGGTTNVDSRDFDFELVWLRWSQRHVGDRTGQRLND
jgi:3-oxoacyl-[acyl-carrier-protein] synthase II